MRARPTPIASSNLDAFPRSRNAPTVLVPRVAPGRQEGTRARLPFAASSVAAPATVSGEPVVRVSHWETGKAGRQATTREPGDLPAQSPNRWAEGPHGAAFRSGDRATERRPCEMFSHDPKREVMSSRATGFRPAPKADPPRAAFMRLRFGPVHRAPRGAHDEDACHGSIE